MVDLKQKPFCLKDEQERLVYETLSQMTDDEKIGQLFFPIGYSADPNYLRFAILNKRPGGLMFRMGDPEETAAIWRQAGTGSRTAALHTESRCRSLQPAMRILPMNSERSAQRKARQ